MSDYLVLEGRIAVEAVLRAQSRDIHTIYIREGKPRKETGHLERSARAAGVAVERADEAFIQAHATGRTHGGVIAFVGPRKVLQLEDLLREGSPPFIVMLDGVEDPFNFGYALRAFYAAGVDGVVVRHRDWTSAAGVVARASAGASELIPLAEADSAPSAAEFFRAQGLAIACTAKRNAVSIYETDLTVPLFLLLGGERRGITRSFVDGADILLGVPYSRQFGASLPTASAAAVIAFEVMRQRSR